MSDLCKEIANMGKKGVGNENQYRILEALMNGPLTVCEIAKKVNIPPASSIPALESADVRKSGLGQVARPRDIVFGQCFLYGQFAQKVGKKITKL